MGFWLPLLVVVLGVVFTLAIIGRHERINQLDKREKRELIRLRLLEENLRLKALDEQMSDPFAVVVLDEIGKSNRNIG